MKLNEISKLTGKALFEALDRDNDTGLSTSDLVAIVEQERSGEWDDIDGDDFLAELDADFAAANKNQNR